MMIVRQFKERLHMTIQLNTPTISVGLTGDERWPYMRSTAQKEVHAWVLTVARDAFGSDDFELVEHLGEEHKEVWFEVMVGVEQVVYREVKHALRQVLCRAELNQQLQVVQGVADTNRTVQLDVCNVIWTVNVTLHQLIITSRKRGLGQGNIFRSVCQEFCPQGGCLLPGGYLVWGGCLLGGVCSQGGAWWRPPQRLLLRAVRILLECILVHLLLQY